MYLLPSPTLDRSHIFSSELQVVLLVSVLSDAVLTLLIRFVFLKNGHSFLDAIIVCGYCCLILLSVLICFLNKGSSHQSNAAFFTALSYLRSRRSFCSNTIFLKKYFNFWGFLSVPYLVDLYAENADEQGRNFMCERTLPSILVQLREKGTKLATNEGKYENLRTVRKEMVSQLTNALARK